MKSFITVLFILVAPGLQSQPASQKAFCKFVISFNQGDFDKIYNELNDGFQKQVDRAVVTGGILHIFETHGRIHSAVIERQTSDEGTYLAIGDEGVFRVFVSVDAEQRIDGLRIKAVAAGIPLPAPSLVFNSTRRESSKPERRLN
jgi:hypothetical protein